MRFGVFIFACLYLNLSFVEATEIKIASRPVEFDERLLPDAKPLKLEWRGGMEVASIDDRFGGISGILLEDQGNRLIAITDTGNWITANVEYRDGVIHDLTDTKIEKIRGAPGEQLSGKFNTDAEGLARAENGDVLVSFERNHRIARYDFSGEGPNAIAKYIALPPERDNFYNNSGFEAVGQFTGNQLSGAPVIAVAEEFLDDNGHHSGWLIRDKTSTRLAFQKVEGFAITDLTILDDGSVILLERSFSVINGPAMRLRLVTIAELTSGNMIAGEELLRVDRRDLIDNMEALTTHVAANGETILTVASDDNFQMFQRSLILQFALIDRRR